MDIKKFPKKLIGEILIEEGFLEREHLKKALELQKTEGGLIGSILVRMGWIKEEELVLALSKQLGLPYIRLSNYNVNRNALKLLPKEVAARHLFFPFEQDEHEISVAMSNPLDEKAWEAIEKRVPFRIQIFLATASDIREAIDQYYRETPLETEKTRRME